MKNIITGPLSTVVSAIAVFALLASPVAAIAADLSSGGSGYDYSYTDSGSGGYGYDYSYPDNSGYDYGNNENSSYSPAKNGPTCSLKSNKGSIEKGESFTLEWKTKNAKKVTLSGYGEVKKDNTKKIDDLTSDKTYTLTVKGENGDTITCKETVKVKQPAPECTLSVSSGKVEYGGSVTVSWTTAHADTVKLEGDSVSKDGSKTFTNLTKAKTFNLKAEKGNKDVTCQKTVEVKDKPVTPPTDICPNIDGLQTSVPSGYELKNGNCVKIVVPPTDVCPNLSGVQTSVPSGYKLENGQCVKIVTPPTDVCSNLEGIQTKVPSGYELQNGKCVVKTTPTDFCPNLSGTQTSVPNGYKLENNQCVVVTNDIQCPSGSVLNGNICVVNVNNNNNQNNNQNVNNNNVIVNVNGYTDHNDDDDHDNDNDNLWCRVSASRTSVQSGDTVRISWDSRDAERGYINGIGWVDEDGSDTVRVYQTTTFTGTFYDNDDDWVRCSVTVYVQNYYPTYPQTPYVTLSAVPYTGLELGPVGTALYWSFLVLWCLIAAYLIAVKKTHVGIARRIKSFLFGSNEMDVETSQSVDVATLTAMVQAIVNGQQHTPKVAIHTSSHSVTADATDDFILSQIHRK